ncbi:hypothetical protein PDESU_05061 [Pontiella desulfatans]|uniref:Uncharacterized protein n=1 Tax=Pontiella desulfatans TaxID=2750659 RepID=A0A6C2U8S7_PONDE|nr:hypothetical protein PDESU_05061 [Pontiella desulfatans]
MQQTRSEPTAQNAVTFPAYLCRSARRPLLLPVLQGCGARTYGLPPRTPCGPSSTKFTSRCFALPPKPPATGGMCSALRAKEEIVHPASLVDPSTPSAAKWRDGFHPVLGSVVIVGDLCSREGAVRFRSPQSASFTNSPLSALYRCRLLPPRRTSAAFAFHSPGSQGYRQPAQPSPSGEFHANSAQALQLHSGSPADPNGSRRSGRTLPSRLQPPGPFFLRGPTAYPAGLGAFGRTPSAVSPLRLSKICRAAPVGHVAPSHCPAAADPLAFGRRILRTTQSRITAVMRSRCTFRFLAPGSLKQNPFC